MKCVKMVSYKIFRFKQLRIYELFIYKRGDRYKMVHSKFEDDRRSHSIII